MGSSNLYTVNTTTGTVTNIGPIGFSSGGDLAFVNGTLYLTTSSNQLVSVNTATGAGTLIGDLGVPAMYGLATPGEGTLYGVAGTGLYFVDTSNGAATLDVNYGGHGLGSANGESFIHGSAYRSLRRLLQEACVLYIGSSGVSQSNHYI